MMFGNIQGGRYTSAADAKDTRSRLINFGLDKEIEGAGSLPDSDLAALASLLRGQASTPTPSIAAPQIFTENPFSQAGSDESGGVSGFLSRLTTTVDPTSGKAVHTSNAQRGLIPAIADGLFGAQGRTRQREAAAQEYDLQMQNARLQNQALFNQVNARPETYEDITDETGQIIGQRSSLTNKVVSDPRAQRTQAATAATDIGKLRQDMRNGFLTPDEFENQVTAMDAPKPEETKQLFANADKLRDEFVAQSKDFRSSRDAFARVQASALEPSAAGDLALIFNYMKVLDPGSVVRESEFATAAASGSYGERLQAAGNKILSGERLSDDMRKDFVGRAEKLFSAQSNIYGATEENYRSLAEKFGVDPGLVVQDQRGGVENNAASPPQDVEPELWSLMTPEERALFQ